VRQHGGRIGEVLERVERDDHIDGIVPFARERAAFGDARRIGVLDAELEPRVAQVDADDMPGAVFGDFDDFAPGAAAEVEDLLPAQLIPDPGPEQHLQLAAADVGRRYITALHRAISTRPIEQGRPQRSSDQTHRLTSAALP